MSVCICDLHEPAYFRAQATLRFSLDIFILKSCVASVKVSRKQTEVENNVKSRHLIEKKALCEHKSRYEIASAERSQAYSPRLACVCARALNAYFFPLETRRALQTDARSLAGSQRPCARLKTGSVVRAFWHLPCVLLGSFDS